ncbi:MAG TPA: hypothetical protein VE617_00545 [Propionibacteriaceae bacterium]|nr:hypothetical protein [Propionibacteriaceae bacterium]
MTTPRASTASSPAPAVSSVSPSSSPSPSSPSPTASGTPTPDPGPALPRGGREIFPTYRLVGYAGLTGASTLGRLGTGPLDQRVRELEKRARPYAAGRKIMPVLEVITTIVHGTPGKDGKYRSRISNEEIETYLRAARKRKALLLLNIQPGRSEFLIEAKAYERWLKEPDVGIALDPEWAMDAGQRPGGAYGHTTGAELNETAEYLAGLVREHDLPEKVMVYHQVAASVVRKESGLKAHDGVAIIKSVDALGPPGPKINTYRVVNKTTPKHVHAGFKLFFTEDTEGGSQLMSPREVLRLKPQPEYVMYE